MTGSLPRRMNNVDWRFAFYFLIVPIILFYGLTLPSCVSNSPGMHNLFITQLEYRQGNEAISSQSPGRNNSTNQVQVRVGYFGLCAGVAGDFVCVPTSGGASAETIITRIHDSKPTKSNLSLNEDIDLLLRLAIALQTKIILCISAAAGVFFVLGLVPLLLLKRNQKKPGNKTVSRRLDRSKKCLIICIWSSITLALAAAVGISQSIAAMQQVSLAEYQSIVRIKGGIAFQALHWAIVGTPATFGIGTSAILRPASPVEAKSAPGDAAAKPSEAKLAATAK